jgi:hypothetical protein
VPRCCLFIAIGPFRAASGIGLEPSRHERRNCRMLAEFDYVLNSQYGAQIGMKGLRAICPRTAHPIICRQPVSSAGTTHAGLFDTWQLCQHCAFLPLHTCSFASVWDITLLYPSTKVGFITGSQTDCFITMQQNSTAGIWPTAYARIHMKLHTRRVHNKH